MKKALIIVLTVFAAVFLASAYFLGIFPFNSSKDLGVRYTKEDFERSLSKVGGTLEALPKDTPKEKSIQMNGILNVDTSFTDDGTLEASAQIRTSRLMDYALATNTPKYYTDLIDKFDILPNPPVYIKGKGYVENNKITIENLEEGEVGRIKLEGEMLDAVGKELKYFIEDGIKRTPGLDVNKLTFENGEMDLKGTIPAVESSVNE